MFRSGFGSGNNSRLSFKRDGFQSKGSLGSQLRPPNWDEIRLDKIDRHHYKESAEVAQRSSKEIKSFYSENEITLKGRETVKPIFSFSELSISHSLSKRLTQLKFVKPTAIQSVAIPIALSGSNLVGIAQTGSGKTLAYLLPGIEHIARMPPVRRGDGPIVLVLVPTRELAQQVKSVAESLTTSYYTACVYGGADRRRQIQEVSLGAHICVATPGRLIDFMEQRIVSLSTRCSMVIMDEADRMLDLGFEPQIRMILEHVRADRHFLMFSATWPKGVHRLVDDFMKNYQHVTVGNPDICSNHNITQVVEVVDEYKRDERFEKVLGDLKGKTLVFCETKRKADEVSWRINRLGLRSASIHGDKTQSERERILADFKSSRLGILVATDVASRGLDVHDIKFVVNYDFPNCTEDYVHRIGRTGRAQRSGTSYTFFTPKHFKQARDLIKILREANQEVPHELDSLDDSGRYGGRGNNSRWMDNRRNRNDYGNKRHNDYYDYSQPKRSNNYDGGYDSGRFNQQRDYEPHYGQNYGASYGQSNNRYNQESTSYGNSYGYNQSYYVPPPPPKKNINSGFNGACPPPPPPPRRN